MENLISDNPRKTMIWAVILFALSAVGGQALFALGAIVLFIFGALAWGSYDLHVAKRDYVPSEPTEDEIVRFRKELDEAYQEGLAGTSAQERRELR
jgi:N-acyl-D-aspartate/D-glutamate deacylase